MNHLNFEKREMCPGTLFTWNEKRPQFVLLWSEGTDGMSKIGNLSDICAPGLVLTSQIEYIHHGPERFTFLVVSFVDAKGHLWYCTVSEGSEPFIKLERSNNML